MRRLLLVLAACSSLLPLFSQTAKPAPPAEGFRQEGSSYLATASATGSGQAEAQEQARGAALHSLFSGLGKDRLFAEVFLGSPPVGLSFTVESALKTGSGYTALVTVRIDDESVRIVERGPYLAAAISLLDQAEASQADAEAKVGRASGAEADGSLGEALGSYGMARDSAHTGLSLMEALGDSSIFSSKGRRSAAELRRSLQANRDAALAGIQRIGKAEAELAADDASRAASELIDASLAAADKAQTSLDDSAPILADPSSYPLERLVPVRDSLAIGRRALSDAKAALLRAGPSLPPDRGYLRDKLDFAIRRLATQDAALLAAWKSVDLEIRDPAVRRAARAQAWRWAFLHLPREYLGLRVYLPLGLSTKGGASQLPFDLKGSAEGAFGSGEGVWVRTVFSTAHLEIGSSQSEAEEFRVSQSFDLGFWGKSLFFVGYTWDWYRSFEGTAVSQRPGQVRLGIGGVSRQASGGLGADWTLGLSWEIPRKTDTFLLWNVVNAGAEAQFRLGDVAVLEAKLAHRAHADPLLPYPGYAAVFEWSAGLALRIPPPFIWGAEYFGSLSRPLDLKGEAEDASARAEGGFRFYIGYSL